MYSYSDVKYSISEKKWINQIPSDEIKLTQDIIIPENVNELSDYCFCGCENIQNVIIPENITSFGLACFANCKKLKNVELSSKITELPNDTFYNCCELESITITPNLKTVKPTALLNCKSLKTIWINCDSYSTYLSYVSNIKNKDINNKCKWKFVSKNKIFNITKIANYDKCSYLVLKDVEVIQNCQGNSLIFVDIISDKTVKLYDYAFKNCKKLKYVKCISNINNIENDKNDEDDDLELNKCGPKEHDRLQLSKGCFMNCEKLLQVKLYDENDTIFKVDIPDEAFKNCFELDNIRFEIKKEYLRKDNEMNNSIKIGKLSFENCKFKNINLSNCTELSEMSFMNCDKLTFITLPLVQNIPESCFEGCYNIRKIVFPDTIRKISESAFKNCYKLESVDLRFVKIIDKHAFEECSKLENIESKELKIIDDYAFYKCYSLKNVDIAINKIKNHAFEWCINLETVNLENIKQIGKYAFAHNLKLSKVNIKGTVKQIQTSFEDTEMLDKINIISDTTEIDSLIDEKSQSKTIIDVKLSNELKSTMEKIKENRLIMKKIKEDEFDETNKTPQLILSVQQKLINNKINFIETNNKYMNKIKILKDTFEVNQKNEQDNKQYGEQINKMYDELLEIKNNLNQNHENYKKNREKILLLLEQDENEN